MKTWGLFGDESLPQSEINRANWNSARLGYNFQVLKVLARRSATSSTSIEIDVVVENNGIAPFYYPLVLGLKCPGMKTVKTVPGVEKIGSQYQNKTFGFTSIPATKQCLDSISLSLESKKLLPGRPIKFAQWSTGFISFAIPLPPAVAAAETDTLQFYLVDPNTEKDIERIQSGAVIDIAKTGIDLSLRAELQRYEKMASRYLQTHERSTTVKIIIQMIG